MFDKILIANRGEIACRVIDTCRRMGIATVAVHSEADAFARHVRLADEAYLIGPAASRDSYLRGDRILQAAKRSGAQGVHPGYGFLSENETFANACAESGIVFIGPPVAAIHAMGSKSAAKALMEAAKVPLVPGYHGAEQEPSFLRAQADRIGYPVLIKASAGGGGKGMRVVERGEDFVAALASCQREAMSSFGDDHVLIEKYLQRPRHIEIQVFGDTQGNVIYLNERDCSAQRRHQKVIEEAPAPHMTLERRVAMGNAACDAARAVGYVGAGTVEFIADEQGNFYFMEMNTRLQVEHPVTEMITGVDLVEWQLRIASGEPLPLTQDNVPLQGHAIEVRIYAEEPEKGFLPSIGRLALYAPPLVSAHVRIDTGVEQGDEITPHYDPMIAKLIVHDENRDRAIERMLGALADFRLVGVGNNIDFLTRLVDHQDFRAGQVDTGLIARESETLLRADDGVPRDAVSAAVLVKAFGDANAQRKAALGSSDPHSPWGRGDDWRLNGSHMRKFAFRSGDNEYAATLTAGAREWVLDGERVRLINSLRDGRLHCRIGERTLAAFVFAEGQRLHVFIGGKRHALDFVDPLARAAGEGDSHGGLVAPMPGRIVAVFAEVGIEVDKGEPLLMMEAMKMEHTLTAPGKGRVRAFFCKANDLVQGGVELVDFEALA